MKKFCLEVLTGKALSFDSNLSIKPGEKFFVYKCKLSSSLALLYLVDLFINKLKTKFKNLFAKLLEIFFFQNQLRDIITRRYAMRFPAKKSLLSPTPRVHADYFPLPGKSVRTDVR